MPWRPGGRIAKFESSNNDFRYIFSKLSKLEKLLIWFELDIPDPDAALIDLGQSCPRLENLRIYSSIDLTEWESVPAPLFPSLKFAWIASVNDDQLIEEPDESVAQALAVLIDQQAPKLDRFVALNSYAFRPTDANELSKLVMRAHGRIREINQTRHAKEDSLDLAARYKSNAGAKPMSACLFADSDPDAIASSCQLGYRGGPTMATLKQWLVPSIESVNFRDWSTGFDKSFLQTLKTQCPRLRSIALERVKSGISSQDLNNFFRNSSLENIRLYMEGMPNEKVLVNDELLSTLSELKGLKLLNVISRVGLEVVESVLFKLSPTGFQDLRKVHLMLERPAVETAFKIFKNASKVSFNIASWNDEKMSMFTTLKHMKNLKELSIAFEATRTYLHGKDLFWLSALKQLKKLNISPRQPGHDKIILDSFADVDLQVIFSGLPQLQQLGFLLDVDFPIEALKRLSRSSPKLEEASFSKSWDLKALEDVPGCLFPELQILSLYKPYISTTTNIKPGKLARSLCQHVPKLRDLNFEKDREDRVLCAWEKLSGRKSSIAATKQMESQILLRELMLQHGGNMKMMSGFELPM
ncbi:hypothetical protein E4T47_04605 [Aureobasidium subglaciale]|nr:hypothetical protein E4T47_04605 [Aureobasidium subglaciale]